MEIQNILQLESKNFKEDPKPSNNQYQSSHTDNCELTEVPSIQMLSCFFICCQMDSWVQVKLLFPFRKQSNSFV